MYFKILLELWKSRRFLNVEGGQSCFNELKKVEFEN